jgi:hypothetical protein
MMRSEKGTGFKLAIFGPGLLSARRQGMVGRPGARAVL